jgi:effector-binding domain-containing protein
MEDEFGEIVALLPGAGDASGRVHALELPGVEYAVAVHTGPLEEVDRTYAALGMVVAERAIGVGGPLRENYLSEDRIEVCWPIFQTTAQP